MAQARTQAPQTGTRYYGSVGANTATATGGGGRNFGNNGYQGQSNYDNRPQYNPQPRQGYSGAQMLAAGVGGAVVGGLATHALDNNRTTYVQSAPSAAYGANNQYGGGYNSGGAAPYVSQPPAQIVAVPAQSSGSGFMTFLATLLVLGGIGAGAYFLIKKMNQGASTSTGYEPAFGNSSNMVADREADKDLSVARELLRQAPQFYRDVQDANNRGDKAALERMTDDHELLQALVSDIDARTEPARTRVLRVDVVGNEVLGFLRDGANYIGSIHYSATIAEGENAPEQVLEVYHFVRSVSGGEWRLAGIEQT
jgi:predicted lipid-binding transport protein (Tim44 family)